MRRHLLLMILLSATVISAIGCAAKKKPEPALGPIAPNGFMKQWGATLDLSKDKDEADRLFLRDDLVFLYTKRNRVYTFSAKSGELLAMNQVATPASELRPPVLLGDRIVIPTLSTLEVYDRKGRKVESIELERASRSPAAVRENFLYFGQDYPRGGRLVKMDLSKKFGRTIWELMTIGGAISATPAVFEDGIYAASENGKVYAVAPDRAPLWTSLDGSVFTTEGAIIADVKADDFGVYVASTDSKLYCLDRLSGRIKWTYFGGVPLRTSAIATADRVYQMVPGRGLVAINKTEGESKRQALWTAPAVKEFLSTDEKHLYVLSSDNSVTALDKVNGQPRFRSGRRDLRVTTMNPSGATIYVATRNGEVLAIQPILKAGTVGEVVRAPESVQEFLAFSGAAPRAGR